MRVHGTQHGARGLTVAALRLQYQLERLLLSMAQTSGGSTDAALPLTHIVAALSTAAHASTTECMEFICRLVGVAADEPLSSEQRAAVFGAHLCARAPY